MITFLIIVTFVAASITILPMLNISVTLSPVFGLMAGALYSYADYEEGREHTVQVFLFLIGLTFIWDSPSNG